MRYLTLGSIRYCNKVNFLGRIDQRRFSNLWKEK